jgi:hypothetical protein
MKLNHLFCLLLALLMVSTSTEGEDTSSALTTTFSNMAGNNGQNSSVVFSDASGSPILKNTGYVATGTFKLSREQIELLSSASDLNDAFYQFGAAINFNSIENGAFQGSASGDPAELYDGVNSFAGSKVYIVIGNGSDLITSSEFLVWDSGLIFDGTGPTGGPWEVVLSVDSGDLIIGYSDKNTSDFSAIEGDSARAAFTTRRIDTSLDDHGDSEETATFITANSTTSGEIKDGDDIDYFRIDLSEDGNLFVRINQNLELKLYDGEGNLIEVVQDEGEALGEGVAADFMINKDLAAGTYFVSVDGGENTSDLGYDLENVFEVKVIDLDAAAIPAKATYTGLLRRESDNAPVGIISIKTKNKKGIISFSGRIIGTTNYPSSLFKGRFDIGSTYQGQTYNSNGKLSTREMTFIKDSAGSLILGGVLITSDGERETFNLVSRYYDSNLRKPTEFIYPSQYTYIASSSTTDSLDVPAGDAIGYGKISSRGRVAIKGLSNSGYKYTYKGYLQNGNQIGVPGSADFQAGDYGSIPFFARTYGSKQGGRQSEWLLGTIRYDMSGLVNSVDGEIRYVKPASNSLYYPSGFDQGIVIQGSKYSLAGYAGIPANGFQPFPENALGTFEGRLRDGTKFGSFVFTWEPKGRMQTPKGFTVYAKGKMKNKTGFFKSKFVDYVTGNSSYICGVVLQNKNIVSGQASNSEGVTMRYRILPNEIQTILANP